MWCGTIALVALCVWPWGENSLRFGGEGNLPHTVKAPGLILHRRSGQETRATAFMLPVEDCCSPPLQRRGFFPGPASQVPSASGAEAGKSGTTHGARESSAIRPAQPRVSLSPRFSPGQVFRYEMEFETTTATSRSGLAKDPQGPSKLVITWDATVRMEVLPPGPAAPDGIRLRTTYEKSTASVRSDTFDPAASQTQGQYEKLTGKVVEFSLDAGGKVKSVSGLEDVVGGDKAAQVAGEWIAHLDASSGAPAGGVMVGQKWSSDEEAKALPVAGMVWRTETEYLRNEVCHPPNPEVPPASAPTESAGSPESDETCAVILTHLNLVRPKPVRDPTPEEYRKNGVQSAGTWNGSAQSLTYVSLRSGFVVSVTQTGTEEMDVTLTTGHDAAMHYAGTILSRSQVALVAGDMGGK
jgi:hypothetical protein